MNEFVKVSVKELHSLLNHKQNRFRNLYISTKIKILSYVRTFME